LSLLFRYFRFCIKRILDSLNQADFKHFLEKSLEESEPKGKGKKTKDNKYKKTEKRGADGPTSSRTVENVLYQKKEIAKEHLVTNKRNWGKMSAMMLAAQTHDREIIAHDLCWRTICKVWRNGRIQQQARLLYDLFYYIVSLVSCSFLFVNIECDMSCK